MSALSNINLSPQETKIISFLSDKKEEFYQNLVQFAKNPQTIKLRSVQKIVSDIRKKFREANQVLPFDCQLKSMSNSSSDKALPKMIATDQTTDFNGQTLTKVLRTFTANNNVQSPIIQPSSLPSKSSAGEFSLQKYNRQVRTGSGLHSLNTEDFEILEYLYLHANKVISLEELRDQVCFPKWGSKLPARWFSAISRRIQIIRRNIPEAKNRILTVKIENSTGYMFRG